MRKHTTIAAAAAGLVLAVGAPLVSATVATAAPAAAVTTVSAPASLFTPFAARVDGLSPELTTDDDGNDADLFTFTDHAAQRIVELHSVSAGTLHVEQRVDGEWREVLAHTSATPTHGVAARMAVTVPESEGSLEFRAFATDGSGDRSPARTFFVQEI